MKENIHKHTSNACVNGNNSCSLDNNYSAIFSVHEYVNNVNKLIFCLSTIFLNTYELQKNISKNYDDEYFKKSR